MPKLVTRPPKYARHKASGQAVVKINGKNPLPGTVEFCESKVRYQAVDCCMGGRAGQPPVCYGVHQAARIGSP